jgi:hypothetical protein
MTLKSVKEDLQARTLRAVAGLLGKLEYVVGLRREDGSYSHWGLSRVHGEASAQQALTEAHQGLLSAILRTPLRKLLDDLKESCGPKKMEAGQFLQELEVREPQLLPPNPGAGSRRHLSSVLRALAALAKNPP